MICKREGTGEGFDTHDDEMFLQRINLLIMADILQILVFPYPFMF
jgi:hypothetical protein